MTKSPPLSDINDRIVAHRDVDDAGELAVPVPSVSSFDVAAYLHNVLPTVEKIEIIGIASQSGRSRDALIRPIEQLYTPLASRSYELRGSTSDRPMTSRVLLPELLSIHKRILLIGQPGAGKTTFLRLVTCMLARDLIEPDRKTTWRSEFLGLPSDRPAPIPALVKLPMLAGLFERHTLLGRSDDRSWILDLLAAQSLTPHSNLANGHSGDHAAHCDEWEKLLRAGQVFLLIDGLDEVADLTLRARIMRVFQSACRTWPVSIVVASRPIELEMLRALGFHEATIEPFGPSEVIRFISQWTAALFADRPRLSAGHEDVLHAAIRERPEIRRLATNPVMLTCLCVIHWNEGRLPEGRARVYRAIFNWMLAARCDPRARAGYNNAFAENALASIALAMMRALEGKQSTFEVGEAAAAIDEEMGRDFCNLTPADRRRRAREWVLRECEWSHIIEEIADQQIRFWHLTLQEFLAALALAWRDDGDGPEDWWQVLVSHLDDSQWHETLELFPGCLYDEGGRRRVDRLFERVMNLAQPDLTSEARVVGIVGRLLAPMSAYSYSLKPQLAEIYAAMRARAMAIFTTEGAAQVPIAIRIEAAEALGRAGDPRLREDNFLDVPGTDISMGKYLITVAEFQRFFGDDGYETEAWWGSDGWSWRTETFRESPHNWPDQQQYLNRPVTGVTWFEAQAYCRWLAARSGMKYIAVRLPRADEWIRAASPDGRQYPWGPEPPSEKTVNFNKVIGSPTPVGLYPAGIGPAGHLDLAGNVDEWCEDGPKDPDRRWIKGGSWWDTEKEWLSAGFKRGYWRGNDRNDRGFRVIIKRGSGGR